MRPTKISNTLQALLELREEQRKMREEQRMIRQEQVLLREHVIGRLESMETTFSREIRGVAGVLVDVRELLRDRLDLRDQVGDHERRLTALERRTD